jgi:hypothetical protein
MFDPASLHTAIAQQLADANVPADHRHAFVLVATTTGGVKGVKGVLTTKIDDVWSIDAAFGVHTGSPIEGGIQVKATW